VFFLTSQRLFLFIGEAERYLIYIAVFCLLVIIESDYIYLIFWLTVLLGIGFQVLDIIFAGLQILNSHKDIKNHNILTKKRIVWLCKTVVKIVLSGKDRDVTIFNYLNQQAYPLNIATVPFHLGGWQLVYETSHNFLYHVCWVDTKIKERLDELSIRYPYLDIYQLPKIFDEFDIDYMFIDKAIIKREFPEFVVPKGFKSVDLNDKIILIERNA
jgi:hypothetical protein